MRVPRSLWIAGMIFLASFLPASIVGAQVLAFDEAPDEVLAQRSDILTDGLHRLIDLQADTINDNAHNGLIDDDPDDSGWDWDVPASQLHHTPNASPTNTYGVTGLGILAYLEQDLGDEPPRRFLIAAKDVWLQMSMDPTMDLGPDISFLVHMSIADPWHSSVYAREGKSRYDARVAQHGSPLALAQYVADQRGSIGEDGLVPWELGWLAIAAMDLDGLFPGQGYGYDAIVYAAVLEQDILSPTGYFQIDDDRESYYTVGLAFTAYTMFSTGVNNAIKNEAYSRLVGMQKSGGAFPWNGINPVSHYQSTAYAIWALYPVSSHPIAAAAMNSAADWLERRQQDNGGWEYTASLECTQVDSEILRALTPIYGRRLSPGPAGDDIGEEAVALEQHPRPNARPMR